MIEVKQRHSGRVLWSGETLRGADLRGANLYGANLYGANLRGANLRGANLRGADLRGADLRGANLYGANLRYANLRYADLRDADLRDADLRDANLYGADLRGASLYGANMENCKGLETFCITPGGTLIGYKKLASGKIATLNIPTEAERINAYSSRKCRAAFAVVVAISGDGRPDVDRHTGMMRYAVGETVTPDSWCNDKRIECAPGIHFFITREEAEAY